MAISLLLHTLNKDAQVERTNPPLTKVSLSGEYTNESDDKPHTYNSGEKINSGEADKIYFKGRFNHDIPENMLLMFYLPNVKIKIKINETELYSFEHEKKIGGSISNGSIWARIISPGISKNDDVEIWLESIYDVKFPEPLDTVFNSMYYGYDGMLITNLLNKYRPKIFVAIFIMSLGFAFMVSSIIISVRMKQMNRYIYLSIFIINGGLWNFIYLDIMPEVVPYPAFNNVLLVVSLMMMPLTFFPYIISYMGSKTRNILFPLLLTVIGSNIVLPLVHVFNEIDLYSIQFNIIIFINVSMIIALLCVLYEAFFQKNKEAKRILPPIIILEMSILFETLNYSIFASEYTFIYLIGYLFFVFVQFLNMVDILKSNAKKAREAQALQAKLLQSNIKLMLSQISPHFLFNSLNTIQYLCDIDPKKAERAIGDFAKYLRGNLESLNQTDLIPIENELHHIENYISLEQMRFGERVKVVYDLQARGFSLPTLTIQPIVENAIKHGITKKPEGGTIHVKTWEQQDNFIVEVSDDGVGFDKLAEPQNEYNVGIKNVSERLQAQCGGQLDISSIKSLGTTARITIPKIQKLNQDNQ